MEVKQFNSNCKRIATHGAKLFELVVETALAGLVLCQETGEARHMLRLYSALPKGYRRKAFILWCQAFSPIRFVDGKEGMNVKLAKEGTKGYTPFDHPAAAAVNFEDFSEENAKVEEITLAMLEKMLKRFAGYLEAADAEGNVANKQGEVIKHVDPNNVVNLRQRADAAIKAIAA